MSRVVRGVSSEARASWAFSLVLARCVRPTTSGTHPCDALSFHLESSAPKDIGSSCLAH